jgi:hypothetical protein
MAAPFTRRVVQHLGELARERHDKADALLADALGDDQILFQRVEIAQQ